MNNTEFAHPTDPILRTAMMVKAIHWYCGKDRQGSTHCTGKILEWVAKNKGATGRRPAGKRCSG